MENLRRFDYFAILFPFRINGSEINMKKIIALTVLALASFNSFANDNAKRLTEQIIKEDIAIFRNGGDSMLSYSIPTVNASQLINEYSNNQYKYEKTYSNQVINIKTVASGVKTDLSGDPFVVANGKNQFEYVSLELKNKDDAMNINKGSKLDLICVGTKDNVMFPILKKCVTSDSYFQIFLEKTMNNINELSEEDTPQNIYDAFYLALWKFDTQKPNALDKYKTPKDFRNDKPIFDEIIALVKANSKEEKLIITMPKP